MTSFNRYYYDVDIISNTGKKMTVPYSVKARTAEEAERKIKEKFSSSSYVDVVKYIEPKGVSIL